MLQLVAVNALHCVAFVLFLTHMLFALLLPLELKLLFLFTGGVVSVPLTPVTLDCMVFKVVGCCMLHMPSHVLWKRKQRGLGLSFTELAQEMDEDVHTP